MKQKGSITYWDDGKGFGFITPDGGGERVFAHISAFHGRGRPSANHKVIYVLTKDTQGRLQAVNFQYSGVSRLGDVLSPGVWFAMLIAAVVVASLWLLFKLGYMPLFLPVVYGVMSLITFCMYKVDKGAAERGSWRVPEGRLHLFEFLCGWPGALVGQQFFRHKTRKLSFQMFFWFYVLLNLAVLGWLLVWPDAEFVRQQLGIKAVMLIRI